MKKLGIIGGLGPMATAHFLTLITRMSEAKKDQDHIEIILHSRPVIPDRSAYITGASDLNPEPDLIEIGQSLVTMGAEILAIPCFTAHYFIDAIRNATGIPIIDAIDEVTSYLSEAKIKKVGIHATDGVVYGRLYQDKLENAGITTLIPNAEAQKQIVEIIYKIKSGQAVDFEDIHTIALDFFAAGAELILLGCSDLSILGSKQPKYQNYLDVLEILARRAVIECGKLRKEYIEL